MSVGICVNNITRCGFHTSRILRSHGIRNKSLDLAYKLIPYTLKDKNPGPILIMHGLFGNKMNNRYIGQKLHTRLKRDVYLLDLRNHGESPINEEHTYDLMSADVMNFLKQHGLKDSILIGHSMGAKVAMEATILEDRKHPKEDMVKMCVSIENAPVTTLPLGKFIKYIDVLNHIIYSSEEYGNKEITEKLAEIEDNLMVRQFLKSLIKRDPQTKKYKSKIPLEILKKAIISGKISEWTVLAQDRLCNVPILFIRGVNSGFIADEYIHGISQYFSQFEIRDINDAGHWVNAEKPEECIENIVEFVERHGEE
ncbi:hypothetical protein Kpol_385p12 [Vanderwaltozyma polyspora DSM 70294]|uniref:AB hydrolase-1 domain-containing protein n=1 Tax=Vanderwaltozyma polyspora (strain ATCC 22028 / DSM 70294 / BCRC 21397 / CBS 2163 / NBRC 10782 / NRRL Y-8283 / UCD 57-17) TaxID=436907 RepID=A7TS24_VANPO|nr:uncharacterized protein Kpol_385p12 [Vanderwaltozyma polyspora DSM 70294]EDO14943.1 hypothetical protein Kpol_385p12 [Vanderwaltozyma polyspora DSM 70294]